MPLPRWVAPQLSKLVEKAPTGPQWVHEIKFDGFRMAARIEHGKAQLLTRSGLDWTAKYPATAAAFAKLPLKTAYIDGELCGVRADGVTSFELMQQSSEAGYGGLVHFAFDLLELDGENVARLPLFQRKERLGQLLQEPPTGIVYSEHEGGDGEAFRRAACQHGLEGVVSKRTDRPYLPGDRGAWVKSKCLNRAEFIVVGWSDPEGSRHLIGSLLLGYYEPEGRLIYAGRVGTGLSVQTLTMLHQRLERLATSKMPLSIPPPRRSRFGGPLALSKVHWVRPELVAEITYLGWTASRCCATLSFSDCGTISPPAKFGGKWRVDRRAVFLGGNEQGGEWYADYRGIRPTGVNARGTDHREDQPPRHFGQTRHNGLLENESGRARRGSPSSAGAVCLGG
jgi:bifunctional non-homologous end joining protein LigD